MNHHPQHPPGAADAAATAAARTTTTTYGSISVGTSKDVNAPDESLASSSSSSSSSLLLRLKTTTRPRSRSSSTSTTNKRLVVSAFCLVVAAFGVFLFIGGHYDNHVERAASSSSRWGGLMLLQSPRSYGEKEKALPYGDTPRFYTKQLVDHFGNYNADHDADHDHHHDCHHDCHDRHHGRHEQEKPQPKLWTQRYYAEKKFWRGPGHPIFLTVGGEGGLDKGMFNPFVDHVLADRLGAYVLHPEHRFYGSSQPVVNATDDDLVQLLTVEQAMADMIAIANHYRYDKLGCDRHITSPRYCPLISVGGSYPAFVAMLMRLEGTVDIAYASSAPIRLYEGRADLADAYYEALTAAADRASPGCSDAVRSNLNAAIALMRLGPSEPDDDEYNTTDTTTLAEWATSKFNICPGSIPDYIITDNIDPAAMLARELIQLIAMSFADANMIGNYPPTNTTRWAVQLCQVFQNATSPTEAVVDFWRHLEIQDNTTDCFNMQVQLSEGRNPTLSGADWSGLGPGLDGTMWDFQCCMDLLPALSFSERSMFPNRPWTYEWVTDHCRNRFGTVGTLGRLKQKYGFDDLVGLGASRILFVNGGNDMWLPGSITTNLSQDIIAINMPNGAHHSELYAVPPHVKQPTLDVMAAQNEITALLIKWLDEIMVGRRRRHHWHYWHHHHN